MKKQIPALIVAVLLLARLGCAQKLEPPRLEPTPTTPSQRQLIDEGVALHDRGDYDGAISRYEQVIRENPANVEALYEMSFSYYLKKDYQKSLDLAVNAAQYKSDLLGRIYGQIGNCQDDLGRPKQAIETYKAGIKLLPANFLLHFNLGLTYARSAQWEEARASLKKSASLNPNHPSSQTVLSVVFDKGGYKTPALLAALRFLILEPKSKRSVDALSLVRKIMHSNVSQKSGGEISIFMDTSAKKDEGDFGAVDLMVSLLGAENLADEKNKGKTELQLLVGNFESLFSILSEQMDKSKGAKFTWKYYVPYFAELKKQGHTEAFTYYINQQGAAPGADDWLVKNQTKVNEFLAWSNGYKWPKE